MKEKRLVFYATDEAKKTIEQAATLSNMSLSKYVFNVSVKQAIADLKTINLNDNDRDALMKALANPPEPNEALKRLFH